MGWVEGVQAPLFCTCGCRHGSRWALPGPPAAAAPAAACSHQQRGWRQGGGGCARPGAQAVCEEPAAGGHAGAAASGLWQVLWVRALWRGRACAGWGGGGWGLKGHGADQPRVESKPEGTACRPRGAEAHCLMDSRRLQHPIQAHCIARGCCIQAPLPEQGIAALSCSLAGLGSWRSASSSPRPPMPSCTTAARPVQLQHWQRWTAQWCARGGDSVGFGFLGRE